jgi:hypothetical protein
VTGPNPLLLVGDGSAELIAGILTAAGLLPTDRIETAIAAVSGLVDESTVLVPDLLADPAGIQRYQAQRDRPPVRWRRPDPALVRAHRDELERAWSRVDDLASRPHYSEMPALRLAVNNLADLVALQAIGTVRGVSVSGVVLDRRPGWRWRWPLRITAQDDATVDRLLAPLARAPFTELFEVVPPADAGPATVDVWVDDGSADPASVPLWTGLVLLVDQPPLTDETADTRLETMRSYPAGAVVSIQDPDLRRFPELIRALSHDFPLDVAISRASGNALIIADPEFLALTSVRNWIYRVDRQRAQRMDLSSLLQVAGSAPFDSDNTGGRLAAGGVRTAEAASGVTLEVVRTPRLATGTPEDETPEPAESRLLRVKVTDSRGMLLRRGFLAERLNRMRVRIARGPVDRQVESVVATTPFPLLEPVARGKSVPLTVRFFLDREGGKPKSVALLLPATADSAWTRPFAFTPPAGAERATVYVEVLWKRRVVQSAVITGEAMTVAAQRADGDSTFALSTDVSSTVEARKRRAAAAVAVAVIPSTTGEPAVLTNNEVVRISEADIAAANDLVQKLLTKSLLRRQPFTLASARAALIDLAQRGESLYINLFNQPNLDAATWVHINDFGGPPIPFELMYSHERPADDATICGPASAGQIGCAADCPDRGRSDRVCPFGFWGTSKVVERRVHIENRTVTSVSGQRSVPLRGAVVSAVTARADDNNSQASTRIAAALQTFSAPAAFTNAPTWDDLAAAAASAPTIVVLVTHTLPLGAGNDSAKQRLELDKPLVIGELGRRFVNPDQRQPGPVVFVLGCRTTTVNGGFSNLVTRLQKSGAEIVVSSTCEVPGGPVGDFVERLMPVLTQLLATRGDKRFGAVLTAARQQTIAAGDLLALAVTASGDGDVKVG